MKSFRKLSGFLLPALLGACLSSGAASGQDSKGRLGAWDNLKSLTPGQEIRLVTKDFQFYQGQFESSNDDGVTLEQAATERTFSRRDILRISQKAGQDHLTRNALAGSVLGAGAGLGIGLIANHVIWSHVNCDEGPRFGCSGPPNPHWSIILTPVGGLVGTAIGSAIPTRAWRDVYRTN